MQTTFRVGLLTPGVMLAVALMLTSCQTTNSSGPSPELVACRSFEPVTWSEDDSPQTIREIKEHNAVWVAVCKGKT